MGCDDLRLGGTLSASGITGGLSINSTAISIFDWSTLFGHAGMTGSMLEVNGRPGGFVAGDLLGKPRFPVLSIQIHKTGPDGILVAGTADEQLWANTDEFLQLLTDPAGNYLEYDLPDATSRFLRVTALDVGLIAQGDGRRRVSVPLVADWPYWRQGGQQNSQVISGADTLTNQGRAVIYDAVLVFAGNGTLTNLTEGWMIEVTGAAAAVTVDLGARTVTEGGNPATNRIRRDSRDWGWFGAGANSVTATVSVTVTWRRQF